MFRIKLLVTAVLIASQAFAQEIPYKIEVPPVSPDPNQYFNVLHFEPLANNKFSMLYFQTVNASVVTGNEFLADTGSAVYVDNKKKEMVPHSGQVTLLVKQLVEANGQATTQQVWVLANRKMESSGEYRLYLRRGFNHPVIKTDVPVQLTLHNLDNVKGLTDTEHDALVMVISKMYPQGSSEPQQHYTQQSRNKKPTIADDFNKTKDAFRALGNLGTAMRGDLPRNESILTRYTITPTRNFAITKSSGKPFYLKFYISEDDKKFDLLDSAMVEGSVELTSIASVYDQNGAPSGAVTNFLYRYKDSLGADRAQQLTFGMDQDYKINQWKHNVGKNKLSSLRPEICWFKGDKMMVMSNNSEKFFKTYYQLHEFTKGKPAVMSYPTTEEEKGTEKFQYTKSFQAEGPIGVAPPIAEKNVPLGFATVRGTQYIFTQGQKKDAASNTEQFLSLSIYRISPEGKVTNIDNLPGYISNVPVKIDRLVENLDQGFFMLNYFNKLQIKVDKDKSEITPMVANTERLEAKMDGALIVKNTFGSALLKRSSMGTSYTILFYPEQK